MESALRCIIAKSPAAGGEAMRTIAAIRANSPMVAERYNRTVQAALEDAEAQFTPAERAEIAASVSIPETQPRDLTLRVRLTAAENSTLSEAAAEHGQTVSEYVRRRLFDGDMA